MILKDFKSNNFVTAHSKGLAGTFFVTAHSKRVTDMNEPQTIAPPKGHEPLSETRLSLACSCPVACSSHSLDAETKLRTRPVRHPGAQEHGRKWNSTFRGARKILGRISRRSTLPPNG